MFGGWIFLEGTDLKKFQEEIQKITDNFIKEVDKVVEAKEKELLTV